MSTPPSPPYPKNCGNSWDRTQVVTGEIYGKGGFGKDIKKTLAPIGFKAELHDIGRDRGRQQLVQGKIRDASQKLANEIARVTGAGGQRRILSQNEELVLLRLLEQVEVENDAVTALWDKWIFRKIDMGDAGLADGGPFPLDLEDRVTNFPGGGERCAGMMGQWIPPADPRGADRVGVFCPTLQELQQRPKDRAAIRQRLIDAYVNLRCAQVGLYRMLLYKQALAAWHDIDLPEFTSPTEPPGQPQPLVLQIADLSDVDMCKVFGICPDDLEPGPVEPHDPGPCPGEWCIDPDSIPPPGLGGIGPELPPERKEAPGVKRAMSDATTGLLIVAGAATLGIAYKLLAARA